MINIASLADFTPKTDQELTELVLQHGQDWKKIQLDFIRKHAVDIKSPQIIQNRYKLLQDKLTREQLPLTKEEQDYCWLAGLKACSYKQPISKVWQNETKIRKIETNVLRQEFIKQFQKGLLQLNQMVGLDRQKNAQVIKNIADSTIYVAIQSMKEDGKDQQFQQLKQNVQKLITLITYLMMAKVQNCEALLQFCTREQFQNILISLSKLDQMRLMSLKPTKSSSDPLSNTYTYLKMFQQTPIFDPFNQTEEEEQQKETQVQRLRQQQQPQQQQYPQQQKQQKFQFQDPNYQQQQQKQQEKDEQFKKQWQLQKLLEKQQTINRVADIVIDDEEHMDISEDPHQELDYEDYTGGSDDIEEI